VTTLRAIDSFHISVGPDRSIFIERGELWDSEATVNGVNVTKAAPNLFVDQVNRGEVHRGRK
jgi:hypothetical protein